MEKNRTILIKSVCFPIVFYQKMIKPVLPTCCRFYPSCSNYAIESFVKHGIGRGAKYTFLRLLRCQPWHAGGYDPVPDLPPSQPTL